MRSLPTLLAALAAAVLLPVAAPAAGVERAATIRTAPYVDITRESPTLPEIAQATGQKHFTLAFVLGSSAGCDPQWGGQIPLTEPRIVDQVTRLREMGGDVIVASGGALGPYLERSCRTADELLAAYRKTLDAVGANHLDIDVEASIPHDVVNEALARLQAERGTEISYTLRVQSDDTGLDPYSYQVLQSAAAHGVDVLVNPMTMEFGSSKPWGDAVIAAAESTLGQMRQIWPGLSDAELKARLGVTPMIGRNFNGKVFDQSHARQLVDWAAANRIGLLSFWSAGRDNGRCPGGPVAPDCSSIAQSDYEFTRIFGAFAG
ncbi:chitinase [Saccharopolyspora spinosporotrichia]|uniref:Chitinase n=1 Tax=Saccharopolyspora erythraea TaxID=1836 RepID=A0ABP3MC60_SACER